jgi:hypothetical protein
VKITGTTQFIYFDRDDELIDGNGWNVVDIPGSISCRFPTRKDAIAMCEALGFTWLEAPIGNSSVVPSCDVCDATSDGHTAWCGVCGCCIEHCQLYVDCMGGES